MKLSVFTALVYGWIYMDPVHAKALLKPLQQEDKDFKSAFQKLDDPFKQFADEPEVSSALVVSNTSEKQDVVDNAGTALVSSGTPSEIDESLCDYKTHLSAWTGIIAGGAAIAGILAAPATGGASVAVTAWAWVAAVSTVGNGVTNYIECPETTYDIDLDDIRKIAEEVYFTNEGLKMQNNIKSSLQNDQGRILFHTPKDTLQDIIRHLKSLTWEVKSYENIGMDFELAGPIILVFSYVVELYYLLLMKTTLDSMDQNSETQLFHDPNTGDEDEDEEETCGEIFRGFRKYSAQVKTYLDTLSWRYIRRDFINHPGTKCWESHYKDKNKLCGTGGGGFICTVHDFRCDSDFGKSSNQPNLGMARNWVECPEEGNCQVDDPRTPQVHPITKDEFADTVYKPKYEKWYRAMKLGLDGVDKVYEHLQSIKGTGYRKLCHIYKKPLCYPKFFPDAQLHGETTKCCDSKSHLQCGQYEGSCNPKHIKYPDCKEGYDCLPFNEVLKKVTPEEEQNIYDRTGWTEEETNYVCFKKDEPIPPYSETGVPKYNFKRETESCEDSAECSKDLCCENKSKRCEKIDVVEKLSGKMCMRSSTGNGGGESNGGGFLCNVDSDCLNPDRCCETTVDGNNPRCWMKKGYPDRKCTPDKLVADDGEKCYTTADCKGGYCCDKETKTCKEYYETGDNCMADPQVGDGSNGDECSTDSSDCGTKNNVLNCCTAPETEGDNPTWCYSNAENRKKCLPDPLRGGYGGMRCLDSSDCIESNCCFEENNLCYDENTAKNAGKLCLRDPNGGGKDDLYKCINNSECASGRCNNVGICGGNVNGAACDDSSECGSLNGHQNCCHAGDNACYSEAGAKNAGKLCLRDPDGGGKDDLYKCNSSSDCASGRCNGGICGGNVNGEPCDDSSDCGSLNGHRNCCHAGVSKCYSEAGAKNAGKLCLRDPNGGGLDGLYKCTSNSDCVGDCDGGICKGGNGPQARVSSSHDESTPPSPTEPPCCENGENLISKILHAKSVGGEHTMGLKTVIQKVLM